MCRKLAEILEEGLRKWYRVGFLRRKKEKYILIKIQILEMVRILLRIIFYFILIFGGYLLTILIPIIKSPSIYFGFAFFIIIEIALYDGFDNIFKESLERLRKKSHRLYGPDFNIKRINIKSKKN